MHDIATASATNVPFKGRWVLMVVKKLSLKWDINKKVENNTPIVNKTSTVKVPLSERRFIHSFIRSFIHTVELRLRLVHTLVIVQVPLA
jgi:hypothetical protein